MKKSGVIISALAALLTVASASAASSQSSYHLRGEPPSGSKIPSVAATAPLPFDTSYVALSASQKALVKSAYESLGLNDTPPFPRHGLKQVYQPVIEANHKIGATGDLVLIADVNQFGFVETITVQASPAQALSLKAEEVLRSARFDPASCDGQPCRMTFPVKISFQ
ncbi:hypothetical protein GCM10008090_08920 [Arenicella chitinivorans]|uniref:TonB C-terminal domain-containing protein n=1 Tax=Arenicella chitinivorans TaxID=1329800 RepID=A0A918VIN7_9GAMM|nr:energy transducer TonB [Arenicella chitinivorans]GHA01920.1 hypothetical protein GCM10008090_08920 [Arenicella chitinivorans]